MTLSGCEFLEPRRLLAAQVLLNDDFSGSALNGADFYVPQFDPNGSTFLGQTQLQVAPFVPPVSDDALHLPLDTYNPTARTPGDSFYGSEIISRKSFNVGQGLVVDVKARVSATAPPGIVSAPFLYSSPDATGNHDEIDFEFLTNSISQVQTNVYANQPLGAGSPASTALPGGGDLTQYHTYEIKWLPQEVQWSVDGQVIRTEADTVPAGPMSLYLNTYVPGSDWTAAYNPSLHPVSKPADNQAYNFDVAAVTVTQLLGPGSVSWAPTFGNVRLASDVVAGAKLNARVPIIITNQGSTFAGETTINLYANSATSLDTNQTLIASITKQVSIKSGKSRSFSFNIKALPATLADGSYHLLAEVIDPSRASSVIATTQTVQVAAAFIQPAVLVGPVIPASIAPGKFGAIRVTVTNHGNVPASGVEITLSPSADGVTPLAGVILERERSRAKIQPNRSMKFRLRFKASSALATGSYFPYVAISLGGVPATAAGTATFTAS
jgi:hypothetical protein